MASEGQNKALNLGVPGTSREAVEEEEEVGEEEIEIQDLERELKEMADRILHFRRTIPDRLCEALSSSLVAQRPLLPPHAGSGSRRDYQELTGGGQEANSEAGDQSEIRNGDSLAEADREMLEKLRIFRAKTSSNIAAMPKVLKRMNDCIARIERINEYNVDIHSVFRRKRKH